MVYNTNMSNENQLRPSLGFLGFSFFKINLVTFGGGYAIMPIIKKVYVDDHLYLSEEEMMDILALAQSIPGAMAINTSMLVGLKLRGPLGSVVSLIGAFLPPLLVISVISFFYEAFQTNLYVKAALVGMNAAVSAVMLVSAYSMLKSLLKVNIIYSLILALSAFILSVWTNISVGYILLGLGSLGYVFNEIKSRTSP